MKSLSNFLKPAIVSTMLALPALGISQNADTTYVRREVQDSTDVFKKKIKEHLNYSCGCEIFSAVVHDGGLIGYKTRVMWRECEKFLQEVAAKDSSLLEDYLKDSGEDDLFKANPIRITDCPGSEDEPAIDWWTVTGKKD